VFYHVKSEIVAIFFLKKLSVLHLFRKAMHHPQFINSWMLLSFSKSILFDDYGNQIFCFNTESLGLLNQVYPEGTHLMIPWFERPIIYDVRARPHLVESTSGSRDLQMVSTQIFLSCYP
jgi:hypothetical protein